ncbi:RusA family crossover junction endodeoxyribonuclease [Vibrio panuliri]|uniref:Uncharacterized protein n=1 Tax=Vibrio panuliri TaxID=1381081 RepID=A0ABX3FFJ1_9VIBR|nr:RusA family crossover junction endodeoxyribonuclease [Vibrio panuliri]KAB1460877.1 RusA family crossover junction endodeoxyribonuclease [Vibrio panuliri]OLQ91682.1 hypothetical protein BIY20_09775 [Vibrio panuliri]
MKSSTNGDWVTVRLKPLSVNEAYFGSKTKTARYRKYEDAMRLCLPDMDIPDGKLALQVEVTYARASSDIDNFLKAFIDCLQKRYEFNDNRIYKLRVIKHVDKDDVGIRFKLTHYPDSHAPSDGVCTCALAYMEKSELEEIKEELCDK